MAQALSRHLTPGSDDSTTKHSSRKTILLIDDSLDLLMLNQTILEMAGYGVLTATSGAEGLSVIDQGSSLDLILLDMLMEDLTGAEFLEVLRERKPEFLSKVPVVFLTGLDDVKLNGAAGVIRKPIEIDRLISEVGKYIERGASPEMTTVGGVRPNLPEQKAKPQ